MTRVTLQTVADRVGVSRMTVSNAFSRPDQLSTALREKVLAAAAELGYVGPDPAARALARGTAGAIGVLMTDSLAYAFSDEVATGFLGAVADELAPTGLALTLLTSGARGEHVPGPRRPDGRRPGLLLRLRLERGRLADPPRAADGVRRPGAGAGHPQRQRRRPRRGAGPPPSTSSTSGTAGSASSTASTRTTRRRGGGHARPASCHVSHQRMLGWTDALDAAGLEPVLTRESVRPPSGAPARPSGRRTPTRAPSASCSSSPDRPTAMLCFSDVMAYRVVRDRRGAGAAGARGPLGGRLRRQPAGPPDAPGSHHGAPGRERRRAGQQPRR